MLYERDGFRGLLLGLKRCLLDRLSGCLVVALYTRAQTDANFDAFNTHYILFAYWFGYCIGNRFILMGEWCMPMRKDAPQVCVCLRLSCDYVRARASVLCVCASMHADRFGSRHRCVDACVISKCGHTYC